MSSATAASSSSSSSQPRGKWQREDMLLLLRAWGDVADQRDARDNESESDGGEESAAPPHPGNEQDSGATGNEPPGAASESKTRLRAHLHEEEIADFDARVYRRFLALRGGDGSITRPPSSAEIQESAAGESGSEAMRDAEPKQDEALPLSRTERAVVEKKDALMHSYYFIAQWMESSAATSGDPGERRDWFALTKEQQKHEVRSGFARVVFARLDREMFGALELLAQKKQKSKMRDRVGFQHWHDSEHVQLLRAWGEALRIVGTKRDLNRVLTEQFVALGRADNGGGKRQRSEASIIARKENMVFSYLFISAFSAQNEHRDWFSLPKSEKKQILLSAGHRPTRFVDIDEDMFDIVGMHLHTRVKRVRHASNGEDAATTEAEEKENTGSMEYASSADTTWAREYGSGAIVDVDTAQDDVEAMASTFDHETLPSVGAMLGTELRENEAIQTDDAGAHHDAVASALNKEKLSQNVVSSAELHESVVPDNPPSSEGDAEPLDTLLPESKSDGHALGNEESTVRNGSQDNMEIRQNEPDPLSSEADAKQLDAPESTLLDDVLDNDSSRESDNSLDNLNIHQNEPDPPGSEEKADSIESSEPESSTSQQQQQPTTTASSLESSFSEWDKEYTSTMNNVLPAESSREGFTTSPADSEQEAVLSLFQQYADQFNATLRQIQKDEESGREQRKREREELRVELEKRRRYHEELVQDRQQRALERDRMSQELEQMRVERQQERDHDLALLRTLLKQSRS